MDDRSRDRARVIESRMALVVIAVFFALVARGIGRETAAKLPKPMRSGDAYGPVLARLGSQRLVSVYLGFAARDAGAGGVKTILAPLDLETLSYRGSDQYYEGSRSAYNAAFIRQASGAGVENRAYASVLATAQIQALRSALKVRSYPMGIEAFVPSRPEDRVVLYSDAARKTIYAVPFSASPLAGGR